MTQVLEEDGAVMCSCEVLEELAGEVGVLAEEVIVRTDHSSVEEHNNLLCG